MGEGRGYSTYELPVLKLIKYLGICVLFGFVVGEIMRHTHIDYLLALSIWNVFFVTYYYVTLPAIGLMCIVAYLFRKKKQREMWKT